MQGTGAVNLAVVLSAVRATGIALRDHRIVIFGAGTAGNGIGDQLCDVMAADCLEIEEATGRFWCVDRRGLLTDDMTDLADFQRRYAGPAPMVSTWRHDPDLGGIPPDEVVSRVHPSILIGTSTCAGAFTEAIVRDMATHVKRPVILLMSIPTELAEANPNDLLRWTDGRALVATGSPFPPSRTSG